MGLSFALGGSAMHYPAFRPYIRRYMTVVDVGAHMGQMSLFFSRAVGPRGRVIAIEPNAESYAALLDNLALSNCRNVNCHNIAAGERAMETELICAGGMSQVAGASETYVVQGCRQSVVVAPLDSLELFPDFIKIDVEGFADRVLRGALETIARSRPAVFIDLHSHEEVAAVGDELLARGYSAFAMNGEHLDSLHGACAVFCVHPG